MQGGGGEFLGFNLFGKGVMKEVGIQAVFNQSRGQGGGGEVEMSQCTLE